MKKKVVLLLFMILALTGCDTATQQKNMQMEETEIQSSLIQEDEQFIYVCGTYKILKIAKESKVSETLWEGEGKFWEDEAYLFSEGSGILIKDTIYFLEEWEKEEEGTGKALSMIHTNGTGYERLQDCGEITNSTLFIMDGILYFDTDDETDALLGYPVDESGTIYTSEEKYESISYQEIPEECNNLSYSYNGYRSLTALESEEKLGYFLLRDENYDLIRIIPETGERETLPGEIGNYRFEAMNGKKLLFSCNQEDGVEYYLVDGETFESRLLIKCDGYVNLITMENDYVYLMRSSIENGKYEKYSYEKVHLETGEKSVIFEQAGFIGVNVMTPENIMDITFQNGYLYYIGVQDYKLYLMRQNVEKPIEEILGEAIYDSRISEVGSVETYYKGFYSETLPDIQLAEVNLERLIVDDRFPGAEEINRQLMEAHESGIAYEEGMAEENETSLKEYGESEYVFPKYSFTSSVKEISYIDENYLSFCQSEYDYMGGAHGMPYWVGYTFDLQTGKRLTLNDVIGNSEEELKEIVTVYFAEMMNQNPENFWGDAVASVREWTDFESSFYLTEEGIKFYFEPYALASFADGFQEVVIPYSEFEMKISVGTGL